MDMMADEAAEIMTSTNTNQKTNHGQQQN